MDIGSGRIALYPGTFDPITNGHLDIIARAAGNLCSDLIVSVAGAVGEKLPLFTLAERSEMVEQEIDALKLRTGCRITVRSFDGLLIKHARETGARTIIRGLRAVSDFEYEFQMAGMNASMARDIETVFLMASERNQFISSRFIREICALGGDIGNFVPPGVEKRLKEKFAPSGGN